MATEKDNFEEDIYKLEDPQASKAKRGKRPNKANVPQQELTPGEKKRRKTILGIVIGVLLVCGIGYFVWDTVRVPDISTYQDYKITFTGITDEDIVLTPADLMKLDCVSGSASGSGAGANGESKLGSTSYYGPKLETVLEEYNVKQTDFSRIVVTCKEEVNSSGDLYRYQVVYRGDTLNSDIILSIARGKNALEEYETPCRVVARSEATGKWAYGAISFVFEK